MGEIRHYNNGKWTIYTTGEDMSLLPVIPNTNQIGVDVNTGIFEKVGDGSIIDLEYGYRTRFNNSQLMGIKKSVNFNTTSSQQIDLTTLAKESLNNVGFMVTDVVLANASTKLGADGEAQGITIKDSYNVVLFTSILGAVAGKSVDLWLMDKLDNSTKFVSTKVVPKIRTGIAAIGAGEFKIDNSTFPNAKDFITKDTKVLLTVHPGKAPSGNIYVHDITIGDSITVRSTAGLSDAGVSVHYVLDNSIGGSEFTLNESNRVVDENNLFIYITTPKPATADIMIYGLPLCNDCP
jgi:hypothetical protein